MNGDRPAGGLWGDVSRRLKSLTVVQCLIFIVVGAMALGFAAIILILMAVTMVQAIYNITGQPL